MKPLISIIVPTKNSERTLAACLESIKNQSYKNIEIIVVDNHSLDRTLAVAKSSRATVLVQGNERSAQRNAGAHISKGEYLLFIDSDMELAPLVVEHCVQLMQNNPAIQAITIPEESFGESFWAACKQFERSFYPKVPWIQAVRFFRKSAYKRVQGYDTWLISGEDSDIHNRIIESFGNKGVQAISEHIMHNEGNVSLWGLMKKKFYYGLHIRKYKNKEHNKKPYKKQASLIHRFNLFISQPEKIIRHPVLFFGTIVMKSAEFLAGGLGYLSSMVQ